MKLGIVGAGAIVRDFLEFAHDLNCELICICATPRDPAHLQELCDKHGFKRYYTDYDRMLMDEEIDTIYVAVPMHLHYEYTLKALRSGRDVIVEKAFTSNLKQAEHLVKIARENDAVMFEAISTLYLPTYEKIRELLPMLGDLKIGIFNFTQYSSRYDAFKQGIIKPAFDVKQSGGALMDLNVYNIHFAVSLFGRPEKVEYLANIERDIDTSGILTLSYPDFKCVLIAAKDCGCEYVSALQGNKGRIFFTQPLNGLTEFSYAENKGEIRTFNRDRQHRMYYEFVKYVEAINNHDVVFSQKMLEETLQVMEVIDMAKASAGIVFAVEGLIED
ncbi:MAG: Gfo/Idh/MocA family oxidoreductase [Erysipelotrichaceae bacterium]|nr:Gfo/Idh/MocA family oxidoreductase [Erysipelotrichaceae bacterium]